MNRIGSKKRIFMLATIAIAASLLVLASAPTRVQGQQSKQVHPDRSQPQAAVGSGFTYQGQLKDGGNPANGQYDFQFRLYDTSSGGTQVGSTLTALNQTVTGGLFTTQLDFGATAYQGQERWLEIAVRVAGGPSYTTLSPRQALTSTPYAASLMPGAVITGTAGLLLRAINTTVNGVGISAESTTGAGIGVDGYSSGGTGVRGGSGSGDGVRGSSSLANGVHGTSVNGSGLYGVSTNSWAIKGIGTYGVWGEATGAGTGVYGRSLGGLGVYGFSSTDVGVWGASGSYNAVYGYTEGGSSVAGVYGSSAGTNGVGVRGQANSGTGALGIWGSSQNGYGVQGTSTSNWGVKGSGASGVWGEATASNGTGVSGTATGGNGLSGTSGTGNGVSGTTGGGGTVAGVRGTSTGTNGTGVWGTANNGTSAYGVWGDSTNGWGVYGQSTSNWGIKGRGTSGVWGDASASNGTGVSGTATGGIGIYGSATTGWAGYFQGDVNVTGSCCEAGMGTFKIDHPADPENKYLIHSAVASPEMKTIYDGNVTLDGKGGAVVVLPDYFEEFNSDFRYQFAPIGSSMPNMYIAEKVRNNRFKIGGGKPGGEVSWQVTGIRKDPYAKAHPIEVEVEKSPGEKGKYQHPAEWGQPESKGIGYEEPQRIQEQKEQLEQRDPVATPKAAIP